MGNDILSTDLLVSGLVRSTYNCYQFKDFVEGNYMLFDLNSFLLGFGVGIEDLPLPTNVSANIRDRMRPEEYHRQYRIMYAHLVMKALGKYNRDMIDAVKNKHFGFAR